MVSFDTINTRISSWYKACRRLSSKIRVNVAGIAQGSINSNDLRWLITDKFLSSYASTSCKINALFFENIGVICSRILYWLWIFWKMLAGSGFSFTLLDELWMAYSWSSYFLGYIWKPLCVNRFRLYWAASIFLSFFLILFSIFCYVVRSILLTITSCISFSFRFLLSFTSFITISSSLSMSLIDMNSSVLTSAVLLLNTAAFKEKLNSLQVPMKSFLNWVETVAVSFAKKIMERIEFSVCWRNSTLKNLSSWPMRDWRPVRLGRRNFVTFWEHLCPSIRSPL